MSTIQRMHSSDSDGKASEWLDAPSDAVPSTFTKAMSPNRKYISGLASGGRHIPPQNRIVDKSENGRRGSTSNVAPRPPIPKNIGNRSQSLDELETPENASEGASDEKLSKQTTKNSEETLPQRPKRSDRAKSIETNAQTISTPTKNENRPNDSESNSIGSSTSLTTTPNSTQDDATSLNQDDTRSSNSIGSQTSDRKQGTLFKKFKNLLKK